MDREQAGRTLVQRLDVTLDVQAAVWVLSKESERWRLLLGIKEVVTLGRKKVYQRVQTKVRGIPNISLPDIEVVPPDAPFLRVLRRIITTGRELTSVHLTGSTVNGREIEDAFVYRLM